MINNYLSIHSIPMINNYLSIHDYYMILYNNRGYPNITVSLCDCKRAQEKKHNSNLAPNTFILSN